MYIVTGSANLSTREGVMEAALLGVVVCTPARVVAGVRATLLWQGNIGGRGAECVYVGADSLEEREGDHSPVAAEETVGSPIQDRRSDI